MEWMLPVAIGEDLAADVLSHHSSALQVHEHTADGGLLGTLQLLLTHLACYCLQKPPHVFIMLTLAKNNMMMLESMSIGLGLITTIINVIIVVTITAVVIFIVVIIKHNTDKQYDGIGRHLDDIGRQHESRSGDWQQIT